MSPRHRGWWLLASHLVEGIIAGMVLASVVIAGVLHAHL